MSHRDPQLELAREVQGLPLTGYSDPYMRTLLLSVANAAHARTFVGRLLDSPLPDFGGRLARRSDACGIAIGFSYEGLRVLGAPEGALAVLKSRSPAFAEGASLRAARYLGDTGESAAERWGEAFQRRRAHVWISVHGADRHAVDAAAARLRALRGADAGLCGWDDSGGVPDGQHMFLGPERDQIRMVHFGFRDNITKPSILDRHGRLGAPGRNGEPFRPAPGELLLGHCNDAGVDLWTAETTPADAASFLRNGSFGILRHIQQHEDRFEAYLQHQVERLKRQGHGFVTKDYLKAKMCGRWPNGATVLPEETQPPAAPGPERLVVDFASDATGLGCPFGAHVRRANPRSDPLLPPRERVLFRRGIPYTRSAGPDDRGLIGVFFCARIEDQFELLVSEWLEKNPLGPPNRGRAKDPIAGHHDEPGAEFHIPLPGGAHIALTGLLPFVRTRGTLYALFPSRRALATIATGGRP